MAWTKHAPRYALPGARRAQNRRTQIPGNRAFWAVGEPFRRFESYTAHHTVAPRLREICAFGAPAGGSADAASTARLMPRSAPRPGLSYLPLPDWSEILVRKKWMR